MPYKNSIDQKNNYRRWYSENGRNRADDYVEKIMEWRKNNREAIRAHNKVRNAVKTGSLIKPNECSNCLRKRRLSAHHTDYSQPLKVVWLCSSCHKIKHLTIKANSSNMQIV